MTMADRWVTVALHPASAAIWSWDLSVNEVTWNSASERLLGYPVSEVQPALGWHSARIHPDDRQRVLAGLQAVMSQGGETWSDEYRFRCQDGSYVAVLDHAYVMRNRAGLPVRVVGSMVNVGEHRQWESQFQEAQKLEAVGRLAGGIAHDFNNLLQVIQGYTDRLLEQTAPYDPAHEWLEAIHACAERAAVLTRQLQGFSRKRAVAPAMVDLNEVLADLKKLLPRLIGEDIELVTVPGEALGRVQADVGQMEQVIINLALNARDAMPRGGRLTIETIHHDRPGAPAGPHQELAPGPYVLLSVSDTGSGMDAETRAHLFERFFTTKTAGKGTGLGLAMVYEIVVQSGGQIEIESEAGLGATFRIYLPRIVTAIPPVPGEEGAVNAAILDPGRVGAMPP